MAEIQILKVRSGSKLYGTDIPTSDEDWIEAFFDDDPRKAFCLGYDWHDSGSQTIADKGDTRRHDIRQFVHLASKGQTAFLESVFADHKHFAVYQMTKCFFQYWPEFKANLPTSQMNLVGPALGYASSEYKATFGETTGKLGEQRQVELAKFGYSPKNAHHGIRILAQTLHCLRTGEYTPYPEKHKHGRIHMLWLPFLLDLKLGKVKESEVRSCFELLISELEPYHVKQGDQVKKSPYPMTEFQARYGALNEATGQMLAQVWNDNELP